MSGSDDQNVDCPLCMEPLEMDDINFYPCTCGYQICRFCWHRIRTDENGLCPACRKQYPEDPADFKPVSAEELQKIKSEKKQKDQQRKQKVSENRKHLVNVRVIQKNLVFVVGLSQRLADADVLKRHEYFGKYGKIHKVVINQSTSYAGSQGPSASAYVTYNRSEDALRAIQAANNILVDGRTLKVSLGTTKYCSHFLKGQQCPKSDCMYLHDLGDEAASYTKEEMQQCKKAKRTLRQSRGKNFEVCQPKIVPRSGNQRAKEGKHRGRKHQDYERKLHEQLYTNSQPQSTNKEQNSRKQAASPTANQLQPNTNCKEGWPSLQSSSPNSSISTWQGLDSPGCGEGSNKGGSSPSGLSKQQESGTGSRLANHSNRHQHAAGANGGSNRLNSTEDQRSRAKEKENTESNGSWGGSGIFTQTTPVIMSANQQPSPSSSTSSLSSSPPSSGQKPPAILPESLLTEDLTRRSNTHLNLDSLRHINNYHHRPTGQNRKNTFQLSSENSFFSAANSFGMTNGKLETPTVSSTNSEWLHSTTDPAPVFTSESLPVTTSTDWQAAFGFTSTDTTRDDDLGFDPWDECAKGFADMIEKENQSYQPTFKSQPISNRSHPNGYTLQQQQQQLLMENLHAQNRHLISAPKFSGSEMNGSSHGYSGDGSNHMVLPQSSRRLGAPPGFMPNQPNYNVGNNRTPSLADLSRNNKMHTGLVNYNTGASHFYTDSLIDNTGYNNHHKESGINNRPTDSFSMNEWQESLRALLPNVNVNSGGGQNYSQQHNTLSHHAQQNAGWNNYAPEVSWMTEDPAIVMARSASDNQTDSSPYWLKSLHQLTEEPPLVQNNHRISYPSQYYRSPSWHTVSQTPPPGFATSLRHRHSDSQKLVENL